MNTEHNTKTYFLDIFQSMDRFPPVSKAKVQGQVGIHI